MMTISGQAFHAILAKPYPLWTPDENRAFWAYLDGVTDRATPVASI